MSHIGKFGLPGGNFKKPPQRKTRFVYSVKQNVAVFHICITHCNNNWLAGLFRLNRSYDELTPISWSEYFEHKRFVDIDGNKFATYSLGNVDSVLIVLLHGGGFNALTWSLFAVSITIIY